LAAALAAAMTPGISIAEDWQISTQYKGWSARDTTDVRGDGAGYPGGYKTLKSGRGYRDYINVTARNGGFFATYTTSAFATSQNDWQKWIATDRGGSSRDSFALDGCGSVGSLLDSSCNNYTAKGKQQDQDVSVGYFVLPQLAGTISRKRIKNEFDWSSFVTTGNTSCASRANIWSYGLAANAPFGDTPKTYAYANYNKSFSVKNGDNCDNFSGLKYVNFEFGLAYSLRENVIASIGYREQDKAWRTPTSYVIRETQGGAVVALSYQF
jgi:hypothetical protein